MALNDDQLAIARAIDCIVAVNPRRINAARRNKADSSSVGISWVRFVALVDAVEVAYPGAIERARENS